jgi:hypothetical protein
MDHISGFLLEEYRLVSEFAASISRAGDEHVLVMWTVKKKSELLLPPVRQKLYRPPFIKWHEVTQLVGAPRYKPDCFTMMSLNI